MFARVLILYLLNVIVLSIGNEISNVRATTLHIQFYCKNGGGAMIESILIQIIWLLFYGLISVTIIAFALIITLVVFMSK